MPRPARFLPERLGHLESFGGYAEKVIRLKGQRTIPSNDTNGRHYPILRISTCQDCQFYVCQHSRLRSSAVQKARCSYVPKDPLIGPLNSDTFREGEDGFLRMATAKRKSYSCRKFGANMTITVTTDELKELETALATHYHNLDLKLSNSVHLGGPNDAGIQKCIQRQRVRYLLDRVRLLQFEPNQLDHSLGSTMLSSEARAPRADPNRDDAQILSAVKSSAAPELIVKPYTAGSRGTIWCTTGHRQCDPPERFRCRFSNLALHLECGIRSIQTSVISEFERYVAAVRG